MKKRKKLLVAGAGLVAFVLGLVSSLHSAPAQERFDLKVRNDIFAGFAGDKEALTLGIKTCEATLAADPNNAEALVWHGGAVYYQGGQEFQAGNSQKGMELVQRGLGEMSRAVESQRSSVGVRIPRGAILLQSTLYMPESEFSRKLIEEGLEDYRASLKLQKDYFEKLDSHSRGELLFGIADAERRLGNSEEAERWFQRISTELKGTVYQKRADKWLQTKTLTNAEVQCAGCHTGK